MADDARVAQLVRVEGDGLPVDGADGLQLDGAPEASRAEGVAAAFGGYGLVEGRAADGAYERLVHVVDVLEILVVDRRGMEPRPGRARGRVAAV